MNTDAGEPVPCPISYTRCMRCGYRLAGLEPVGLCPECGLAYDQNLLVLRGDARGVLATAANGSIWSSVTLVIVIGLCVVASGGPTGAVRRPVLLPLAVVFAIALACQLTWRHLVRGSADGTGFVQCRLNRFGCIQTDQPQETVGVTMLIRIATWPALIAPYAPFVAAAPNRGFIIVVCGMFALAQAIVLLWAWTWRRRQSKLAADNPDAQRLGIAAHHAGLRAIPIPWDWVTEFHLTSAPGSKPDRFVLQIYARGAMNSVDVEIDCTAGQAAYLREQVSQWRGGH